MNNPLEKSGILGNSNVAVEIQNENNVTVETLNSALSTISDAIVRAIAENIKIQIMRLMMYLKVLKVL